MITVRTDPATGWDVITIDAQTAAKLMHLLCTARPQGESRGHGIIVRVYGQASAAEPAHEPVEGSLL